jgi:hypothetical protein
MSTQTSAAGRRSVLSALLVRLLQVLGLNIRPPGPSLLPSSKARNRRAFAFETLEPRLLLSADLVGDLSGVTIPAHVLPSDHLTIPVVVHNAGADASSLTPVVRLYASTNGHVDADSIVLGESAIKNTAIKAGKSTTVNVAIDTSMIDAPGSYSLIAVVDATNKVRESNEGNNTAIAAAPLHIDWSFGTVPGHSNTDSITLTDPTGTHVTFKLTGAGHGDVVRDGNAFDLHLTGTDSSSKLSITTSGGAGTATVDDLQVDGSLGSIKASDVNLTGHLGVGGTVRSIDLGDIGQDAGIAIAGTGQAVKFTAGRVTGADIFSASPFDSISIGEWRAASNDAGSIQAASIGDLEVDGNFAGNLKLTGAASGKTLGNAEIGGLISSDLWNIHGSTGSIDAGATAARWDGNFSDGVQNFTTEGDLRGTLAASSIGTIHVGGDMIGARVLVGADLGSDGALGGTGSAADHFFQAVLTQLRVDHSIRDSTILVGVNPIDGIYGNGNDVIVGGHASRIQSLTVDGRLLGSTDITAGAFAQKVKINGANVNSSSVPQLHTSLPDTFAPQLSAGLASDTGVSASDRITSNPTVAGTATDAGGIATLTAALDGSAFKNVKTLLHPDGSFTLDAAALSSLKGSPVADGAHVLALRATDAAGNVSNSSLSFTLDRSAPAIAAFGLDAASDTGIAGDQLTNKTTVTLSGIAEAGAAMELLGTGRTTFADGFGVFSFANVALSVEGANAFTVRATDAAGNAGTLARTVTRDTSAPVLSAALFHDTGLSNGDGWTTDPYIAGQVTDPNDVVSLTMGLAGGQAFEELASSSGEIHFVFSPEFLGSGGVLADGPYAVQLQARDAAGNVSTTEVDFILDRQGPTTPVFDLTLASDTGVQGDQHTTASVVSLTGLADTGGTLTLEGRNNVAMFDGNTFRFDGVTLNSGENVLTVISVDLAGNVSAFRRSIFLDGGGSGPGTGEGPLPDLVVGDIESQATGQDPFGQTLLHVEWTTTNTGSATAHGQSGFWIDSLYASMFDAKDFTDDDIFLGSWIVNGDLAAGAQQLQAHDVALPSFVPAGYHLYVVADDGNQVFEKTAGEYNNTVIDYVPSGMPPPYVSPSGPVLALDGTPTGGSIDAPGETDVYRFDLGHESKIYFDSLSSHPDVKWELQDAGGNVLFGRSFDQSDAFGMGDINALLNLQAGSYKIVVSGEFASSTDSYAFRLMDVDAVAAHNLVLDGGPLLGQHMARGDQTDVYQFDATAGTKYVVGGLGDRAIEQDMVFRLFDPEGHQIWHGDTSPSDINTFAETGKYTLLVEGNVQHTDGFDYNVYVFTPQDRHYELPIGEQVHAFLDSPGQVNTYSFALTGQSALFLDGSLNSNGPYFDWALDGQDGTHLTGNARQDSGVINVGSGNFTLTIHGEGDASGWYDFRMIDVSHDAAPTLFSGTPVSGVLSPGFNAELYRFEARTGDHLSVSVGLTVPDPDWISYDPARWLIVDAEGHVAFSGNAGDVADIDVVAGGNWSLLVEGRQFNWMQVDYSVNLSNTQMPGSVTFDLAPESDTGPVGDHHTGQQVVSLVGTAAPESSVVLVGTQIGTFADENGAFHFDNVVLNPGNNAITIAAMSHQGYASSFTQTIVLDGVAPPPPVGDPLPDLVVTSIDSQVVGQDEFGQTMLHVEWTVANEGAAAAHGQSEFRIDSVYASMFDAKDFTGDDLFLGSWVVYGDLAAGAQQVNALDVVLPSFVPEGYRLYVIADDGNQVYEKTAGEYNNTTIDYVPSGIAPPDIGPSDSHLELDGTKTGGSIDALGETDVYTFDLNHESKIYFDSLSANSDVKWELQDAGGHVLFGRAFDTSDAFGMGDINPLLDLQAGSYKFVVSGDFANGADSYAFRLMDVDAVASHQLILDGGPLLLQHIVRGDQTDVYQFEATAGTNYVVGGPSDHTIEDGLMFRLFDPEGHQVWNSATSPSDIKVFDETGTYTLLVEGNVQHTDPIDYNVYVFTPQDRHYVLPPTGQQVSGFIDAPGQVNTYTFNLFADSSLFVDGLFGSNGTAFDWALDGQDASHFSGNTSFDSGVMDLAAGNYTISIHGEGNASGWYNFRLMDLLHDSAEVLTADVTIHNISYPGFNANLFHFDALAGQHFVISLNTTDTPDMSFDPAQWLLVDPQGHVAMGGAAGTPTEFNPGLSGTWTVLMTGRQFSWIPVDFTLAVNSQVAA